MTLPYHTPLTPAEQASAGITPAKPLALADKVRSSELDPLNHVNNARYFEWFERLRVAHSEACGLATFRGDIDGPRIVIRSGTIHYRQEMRMGEDYVVTCACTAFRRTSYSLAQEVWSGGTLRATFACVMVLRTPDGKEGYPIPEAVRQHFIQTEGAAPEGAAKG